MARRTENECAYCAEEIEDERQIVGKDWKVYCSTACAQAGEEMSRGEWQRLMRFMTARKELLIQEQGL
jgi:hypothetical protein